MGLVTGISIAKSLELHLVRPLITRDEVLAGCAHAAAAHLAAVCVWPVHVATAAAALAGSDTRIRTAIGFPYGQDAPSTKLVACQRALADGAHEVAVMLDHSVLGEGAMVPPTSALEELDRLLEHAAWSSLTAARGRAELTIVLESMLLAPDVMAPLLARMHGSPAGFIQTGTGHQPRAVTEHDIRVLRDLAPPDVAIVAVGGIATLDDAEALIVAGAIRVGSGSATLILEQERRNRGVRPTAS
ncbi:MAG: deoC [Thermoleophilia bacterium]|nr:deoC [Thermoleophilia bacterium]